MRRKFFQFDCPLAMVQVIGSIVHGDEKSDKAFDLYKTLKVELT